MSGLEPSLAIHRVRKNSNMENTAFPTDDDIMRWLSKGEQRLHAHLNDHVKRFHVKEYEFKRDSTTREYDLPIDYSGYFLYLEDYSDGSGQKPDTLNFVQRREFNFDTGNSPDHFTIYQDRLLIDPMPSVTDSQPTMRLGYQRVPQVTKHIGTAQNNSSTEIQLASQPAIGNTRNYDSAYVHEKIRVTAGTGAGQERELVSYDGSTKKASVATKFSTPVSTDSKYQILLDVDGPDEEAVTAYAEMKAQQKDNRPDAVERAEVRDMRREAVNRRKSRGFGRWREPRV